MRRLEVALTLALLLAVAGSFSACTIAVGSDRSVYQVGMANLCTQVRNDPNGLVVHRLAPGLDVRLFTGDSGISLGLASRTFAQEKRDEIPRDRFSPLWKVLPRLDRSEINFRAISLLGGDVDVEAGSFWIGAGLAAGVAADPFISQHWIIRYSGWHPARTLFRPAR